MSITHGFVATQPDGSDPTKLQPSYWNDDHVVALTDADIPATIARDSEVTSAISTHEAAANPHPTYLTQAEGDAAYEPAGTVTTHAAAADPHTGYVKENDANWVDLTDSGQTTLHTHPSGGGGLTGDEIVDLLYPVGSIYVSTLSTNPGTLLAHGTWEAFGAGRVLVGRDSGDTDFDTSEETGGAKTKAISAHADTAVAAHTFTQPTAAGEAAHTHTYTQVVNHTHPENRNSATTGGLDGWAAGDTSTSTPLQTGYSTSNPAGGVATGTTNAGSSHTHTMSGGAVDAHSVTQPSAHSDINVVQPYIVVFMWKRTA